MARETSKNLQKQITPHLIGRLTDADLWTSCGTFVCVRPMMVTKRVGLWIDIEPGWNLTQLRLTTRKSRAMLRPAVQVPGTANTSVQRVSIGNMK